MKMMHLAAVAFLGLTGHTVHPSLKCETPPPLCEAATRAELVFFAEVLELTTYAEMTERGPIPQGVQAVRFNVIQTFKGLKLGQWWGLFYFDVEAKGFKQGGRYLVFAPPRRPTGVFNTGCTLTREMEKPAEEESWLRTGAVELAACFKARH